MNHQHEDRTMKHNTTNYIRYYVMWLFLHLFLTTTSAEEYYFRNLNSNQGLSSNSVNAIYRDSKGFLWIGTNLGLNRYDGYQIKLFKRDPTNEKSIANNYIYSITEDADSLLWIESRAGYSVFSSQQECFYNDYTLLLRERGIETKRVRRFIRGRSLSAYILENHSVAIYDHEKKQTIGVKTDEENHFIAGSIDSKRYLWLLNKQSVLFRVNAETGEIIDRFDYLSNRPIYHVLIFIDSRNNLWIAYNDRFLIQYNTMTNQWHEFPNKLFSLYSIRDIAQNGTNVCIGTDHGGLYVIDVNSFSIETITKSDKEYSLSDNTINSLHSDADGVLWMGTFKYGLDCYHSSLNSFYTYKINESNLLNDINCFAEDAHGNLWIGTNDNGLYKKEKDKSIYTKIHYSQHSYEKGTIVSLFADSKGRMWIGTFMDGLYCYSNNRFLHYTEEEGKSESIDNSVWCIEEDAHKNIWAGTLNKGIFRFIDSENRFVRSECAQEPISSTIECIYKKGNELWFGTSKGIQVLSDTDKKLKHFSFTNIEDKTSEKNFINQIVQDRKGYYWICTQGGLAVLDARMEHYHFFTAKEGIEQDLIYMAIVDKQNNIWVSTSKGLYRVQVLDYGNLSDIKVRISKYGKDDGLQDNIFNAKAGLLTKDNRVIFGGVNGYNIFNPSEIVRKEKVERLLFTDLYINNHRVTIGNQMADRVLLNQSLCETTHITLKYDENNIRMEFSALDLLYPQKYKYEYKLEGVDTEWQSTHGTIPYASYTDLETGKYTLQVRAIDLSGVGYVQNIGIGIRVMPPFWLSWQAYLLYGIVIAIVLFYIIKNIILRATLKYKIQQQQLEKKHLEEINAMKINFFTNLSHELRTPVSLIMLPIENLLAQEKNWAIKNNLNMVLRNAKRLLFIVNQLLDFRKLEVGEISYNPVIGNLVSFVKDTTAVFSDMSQNKNIKLSFTGNVQELYTQFDPTKMERILFNLLSNAFKFTPNEGEILVSVRYDKEEHLPIKIEVTDTGIGINEEDQRNIFQPFYQVESNGRVANIGTGIGLSVIHDFVRLHQGEISVKSKVGKGSTFTIVLPQLQGEEQFKSLSATEETVQTEVVKSSASLAFSPKENTILIVDDNDDFRFYLVENLRSRYNVIEAANGKIGYEKACKHTPDVIVSDVMMPVTNGLELCALLKAEKSTRQIPIILLTASISDLHKIEALELGIDSFLTKPFNVEVLKAQIVNLIKRQRTEKSSIAGQPDEAIASEVELSSLDDKLMKKVISITNENLSDSSFGIEQLSKTIGISSVYLNKKISGLTGKTSSEFVRSIRVKRGAALLSKTQLSISEIAYEVGYTEPKYFSKYFKEEYGILPSEYRRNYK